MVPHEVTALRDAIAAADTALTLILTGSATSDIDDVAPQAPAPRAERSRALACRLIRAICCFWGRWAIGR